MPLFTQKTVRGTRKIRSHALKLVYALLLIVKISYQVPRSWLLFFLQAAKAKRETDKQEMDLEIVSDSNESKGKKSGMLNGKWVGFLQNAFVKK